MVFTISNSLDKDLKCKMKLNVIDKKHATFIFMIETNYVYITLTEKDQHNLVANVVLLAI